jgi:phosphohistidine swiveling domain-containing protein
LHGAAEPPIDLMPLVDLAMRIETLFGPSQDLEWAYRKGRFYILQARDVTAMERVNLSVTAKGIFERERHRLLQLARDCGPDDVVLAQNELSELLPRPTPLSLSFMEELWKPGGSVDLACDTLGIPYDLHYDGDTLVVSVFGSLYLNMQEQRRRTRKGIGALASFRLARAAESIERDFREQFLPGYLSELRLLEAMDFARIPISDLIGLLEDTTDRYFHESHVQVDIINIAADFYVKAAERAMRKRGMNSGAVLGQGAPSVMHQAMDLLQQLREGRTTPEEFLAVFGHRSAVDYELSLPRYREDIPMMEALIRSAATLNDSHAAGRAATAVATDRTLTLTISRAHRFQVLKEEAKHHSLREFAVLRRMLVELDRRLGLDSGIFYLEFGELARLRHGAQLDAMKRLIADRRAASAFYGSMQALGASLTLHDLETMGMSADGKPDGADGDAELRGKLVAGAAVVVGRARVLSGEDIRSIGKDEIVVARYMHPSWTPVFPRLKGIVTEVGGWLSHTSILAREYNITTIIGVKAAEYRVRTGDLLRLNLDGTVEILQRADPAVEIMGDQAIEGAGSASPALDNPAREAIRSSA